MFAFKDYWMIFSGTLKTLTLNCENEGKPQVTGNV